MLKYNFFVDLEFTNSDPMRGQIIECAALVTDLNLNVLNGFHALVRPELINHVTWQLKAQDAHKITPEQALRHPLSRKEFCYSFLNFLAPYYRECNEVQNFVCHALENSFIDRKTGEKNWPMIDFYMLLWSFIYEDLQYSFYKIFSIEKVISTIKMARDSDFYAMRESIDKNGRKTNRKSFKLDLLCPKIGFELEHHKALSDVYGCLAIYKHLTKNKELLLK